MRSEAVFEPDFDRLDEEGLRTVAQTGYLWREVDWRLALGLINCEHNKRTPIIID